jgi:hypothetical protein
VPVRVGNTRICWRHSLPSPILSVSALFAPSPHLSSSIFFVVFYSAVILVISCVQASDRNFIYGALRRANENSEIHSKERNR